MFALTFLPRVKPSVRWNLRGGTFYDVCIDTPLFVVPTPTILIPYDNLEWFFEFNLDKGILPFQDLRPSFPL